MKVLFVSSGNKGMINPLIRAQKQSLKEHFKEDLIIENYLIKGKGILGYLKNIERLSKIIKTNKYDVIHAHYSFSGILACFSGGGNVVTSLMGSDLKKNIFFRLIAQIFVKYFWAHSIVKSEEMAFFFLEDTISVIPNGVNILKFLPLDRKVACESIDWNLKSVNILFAANPLRSEKNYSLAKAAVAELAKKYQNIELHVLENVPHENIPLYMNAADVILLTSKWEGSPNVIKEAMACNRPVVSTNVGDVSWLFGNESGHYIADSNKESVVKELKKALIFSNKYKTTEGRERIKILKLDSQNVAERIRNIYKDVLS